MRPLLARAARGAPARAGLRALRGSGGDLGHAGGMIRVPRLALVAYGLALVVICADQALKYWILDVYRLPERLSELAATGADRPSITVLGPFHLTLVANRGV